MALVNRRQLNRIITALRDAERGPTVEDLASAPILDVWRPLIDLRGMPALWGKATGHPRLGNDLIITSQVISIDPGLTWARTMSRWYRLALPFSAIQAGLTSKLERADPGTSALQFELPGFTLMDDLERLDRILATYRDFIRRIETEHGD